MTLDRAIGLARSIAIYHAIPFRQRRLRRVYGTFVRRGDLVFDVGAHAGNHVRSLLALGCRVVSIEPQPDFARVLRLLFGRSPNVTILETGVSDRAGRAQLSISERTPTVTSLAAGWRDARSGDADFADVRWNRHVEIEVTTIDALIAQYGEPAFIKLDIEGSESAALAGLSRAVPALAFEYLPRALDNVEACVDRLRVLGHYVYNWSPGESYRFASDTWLEGPALLASLRGADAQKRSGDVYAARYNRALMSSDSYWQTVLGAARNAEQLRHARDLAATLPEDDPQRSFIDLYLPICGASADRPMTVGHLGQSLDGFIATHAGDSRFVTGQENILHLHRLRALCDAVVVGAGTVAADDPQLTTRLVDGPSPLRVVIDPARRLDAGRKVFCDNEAETLYVCAKPLVKPGESTFGGATVAGLDDHPDGSGSVNVAALVQMLHARGCSRIFVEGGGVTVSMFLEANLLDRLHVAIAPLIIGDGRPAIRLPARALLGDCRRPGYRVFRMGGDVLFDCDLRGRGDEGVVSDAVTRVI